MVNKEANVTLLERLAFPGPKRILALDGGGIRGAISLGFLEKIEQILRARHKNPNLKLCDYFDLIGGTSTGAIIASALAIGKEASEIKQMYLNLGAKVFGKRKLKIHKAIFKAKPLKQELKRVLEDRILADPSIQTGLCIVTKRVDTRSIWPVTNHPDGKYFNHNKGILLRDLVRASTAAPVYFVPEKFDVGYGQEGAFIDGGVSTANNPSLQLFLVATLKGFHFQWKTGEDNLLLVSIGTGLWEERKSADDAANSRLWDWAKEVPSMLIEDASWLNQIMLQYLSRSISPWHIDREIGDLSSDLLTTEPALSYIRYNIRLEEQTLNGLGLAALVSKLDDLREMSAGKMCSYHAEIGKRAAEQQVKSEHFPAAFHLS
jgi:patatin-like phospholipase/acyl hydrolase